MSTFLGMFKKKKKKEENRSFHDGEILNTRMTSFNVVFFVELNKTNEVKFWLTIYSYFDVY
jgi:hypothetical protein